MGCDKNHYELMKEQRSLVSALRDELMSQRRAQSCDNRPKYMRRPQDLSMLPKAEINLSEMDAASVTNKDCLIRKVDMTSELYKRMALGDFVALQVGREGNNNANPCESR